MQAKSVIAVLEDDKTLQEAFKRWISGLGFEPLVTADSGEVVQALKVKNIGLLFVDCLLPGTSGVDFIGELRRTYPSQVLDVVMMSGIFTDAQFVKETLRTTQAVGFLKKPFELSEAEKYVKIPVQLPDEPGQTSPLALLYSLRSKKSPTIREITKGIEALDEVHGYDLPFLIHFISDAKASGHLNVTSLIEKTIFGISFSDGDIVSVDLQDDSTLLGKILVSEGFILKEDLQIGLEDKNPKMIGARLIDLNLISPHAFAICLHKQMVLRLSKFIRDHFFQVNFVPAEKIDTKHLIPKDQILEMVHDWTIGKISFEWLKAHYERWSQFHVVKSEKFNQTHMVFQTPFIKAIPQIADKFTTLGKLESCLENSGINEESTLRSLHLLIIIGQLNLQAPSIEMNPADRLKAIQRILLQINAKSLIEKYEVFVKMTSVKESENDVVFRDMKKLLGTRPTDSQAELSVSWKKLNDEIAQVENYIQSDSLDNLRSKLQADSVQRKIKAAALIDQAKNLLARSQYQQAAPIIREASELDSQIEQLRLYQLWSRVGLVDPKTGAGQNELKQIEIDLLQISPEDKIEAIYSFVSGLYHKHLGNIDLALSYFDKATIQDSQFNPAKRELSMLQPQKKGAKDSLLGSLFKK